MLVKGGQKEANLSHAESLIEKAAESGAQVVILPECLDLGWTHPSSRYKAEPIPDGEPFKRLSAAASLYSMYLCAGLTEKSEEKIYNTAVFIDTKGNLKIIHRKLNELAIGHPCYTIGDRLNVVETDLGIFGVMICADGFASGQVLSRSLCYMGADVILSPSAWAVSDEKNTMKSIHMVKYGVLIINPLRKNIRYGLPELVMWAKLPQDPGREVNVSAVPSFSVLMGKRCYRDHTVLMRKLFYIWILLL